MVDGHSLQALRRRCPGTAGRSEATMRVVIQQPQSIRKDMIVLGLLVLFGLVTVALLLLPGLAG